MIYIVLDGLFILDVFFGVSILVFWFWMIFFVTIELLLALVALRLFADNIFNFLISALVFLQLLSELFVLKDYFWIFVRLTFIFALLGNLLRFGVGVSLFFSEFLVVLLGVHRFNFRGLVRLDLSKLVLSAFSWLLMITRFLLIFHAKFWVLINFILILLDLAFVGMVWFVVWNLPLNRDTMH